MCVHYDLISSPAFILFIVQPLVFSYTKIADKLCGTAVGHRPFLSPGTDSYITSLPKVIWEEDRVAALSHKYTVKPPLVTMARPKFAPKVPLPVDRSPNPATCLMPWIRSAVYPQYTGQTDRPTHVRTYGPTDRPRESLTTIDRCATRSTRPNNRLHMK